MPCGEHNCPKPCHSGLCGECQQQEVLKCYCGKNEKDVSCSKKGEPIKSMAKSGNDVIDWMGHWACATSCDRPFDCNIHHCSRECHPADISPAHCPFSPDMVTHCPCGKTKLAEILPSPRQTCKDPIAICGKRCDKTLLCGHNCLELCHSGDCGICLETVQIVCRCGRTTSSSMCHQGCSYEPPLCMRTCKATLNCQRHECGEKCCSGETAAMERMGATKKKKGRSLDSTAPRADEGYEPEHICTRPCGKKLKCGTHSCPMLCHRGPCGTCLEANFEELTWYDRSLHIIMKYS